ncbi:hypothetical protein BGLY_2869 [Bacillus glycinifermentans]|nr:hypothetical protein TH62_16165 [Bacillus sp. TH008]SCA86692.1 hypothetical protein BGLY_2869 [Bacillus glycinifermentans]
MTRKSIACTEAIADFPIIKDCDEEDINHKFRIKNGEVTVFWHFKVGRNNFTIDAKAGCRRI